jgi:hypothetical protein
VRTPLRRCGAVTRDGTAPGPPAAGRQAEIGALAGGVWHTHGAGVMDEEDALALGAHWSLDDFEWVPHTLVRSQGGMRARERRACVCLLGCRMF